MKFTGSEGTISSVAVSSTTAVLAAANDNRKYMIVHNLSGAEIFIAFAATADHTAGNYTVKLADGSAYEVPALYLGAVSAITETASGNVNVTIVE